MTINPLIRASVASAILSLSATWGSAAFAQTSSAYNAQYDSQIQNGARTALPSLTSERIAQDVKIIFDNRSGTQEYVAPTFDPFENLSDIAGTASLRTITQSVSIDGQNLQNGAILDLAFFYNQIGGSPHAGGGFEKVLFQSGSYAPVVFKDYRALECAADVRHTSFDQGFHLNSGFYHPYGHYFGHSRFGPIGFSKRGISKNLFSGRNFFGRSVLGGSAFGFNSFGGRNFGRNSLRQNGFARNNLNNRFTNNRNARPVTRQPITSGNISGLGGPRSRLTRNFDNQQTRPTSNITRRNATRRNDARRRDARIEARAVRPQSERANIQRPQRERINTRRLQSERTNTPPRRVRNQNRNQDRSQSQNQSQSQTQTQTQRRADRRANRPQRRSRLNFFPHDFGHGSTHFSSRKVITSVQTDCIREDLLSVHISGDILEAALSHGLTVLATDHQGAELPIYIPANYIEGLSLALSGQYDNQLMRLDGRPPLTTPQGQVFSQPQLPPQPARQPQSVPSRATPNGIFATCPEGTIYEPSSGSCIIDPNNPPGFYPQPQP